MFVYRFNRVMACCIQLLNLYICADRKLIWVIQVYKPALPTLKKMVI